jgi:hypothetical protein
MDATWEIHERYDGRYDIFTDGVLQHQGVPDGWLELQLAPHGITGDLYNEVRRQLAGTGKAIVRIPPPGSLKQVG